MIRWLCDLLGHPLMKLWAPERHRRVCCPCGLTDYFVPEEYLE